MGGKDTLSCERFVLFASMCLSDMLFWYPMKALHRMGQSLHRKKSEDEHLKSEP